MLDGRCDKCRFYEDDIGDSDGYCHRHAPVNLTVTDDRHRVSYGRWPKVGSDNWCGDYEPSPVPLQVPESPVE